jgi:hypothetical protein
MTTPPSRAKSYTPHFLSVSGVDHKLTRSPFVDHHEDTNYDQDSQALVRWRVETKRKACLRVLLRSCRLRGICGMFHDPMPFEICRMPKLKQYCPHTIFGSLMLGANGTNNSKSLPVEGHGTYMRVSLLLACSCSVRTTTRVS